MSDDQTQGEPEFAVGRQELTDHAPVRKNQIAINHHITGRLPMIKLRLLQPLSFFGATSSLLAQAQQPSPDAAAAAACAACGGGILFFIIAIIAVIALNIALLVWVARDAKSRGMDSSVIWMVLVSSL